eukprot:5008558-Pleurochrysis_carterae.AAC.1
MNPWGGTCFISSSPRFAPVSQSVAPDSSAACEKDVACARESDFTDDVNRDQQAKSFEAEGERMSECAHCFSDQKSAQTCISIGRAHAPAEAAEAAGAGE